jgi:hypothetical protein
MEDSIWRSEVRRKGASGGRAKGRVPDMCDGWHPFKGFQKIVLVSCALTGKVSWKNRNQEMPYNPSKRFANRGNCKTPRPRKIDDFGGRCQSRLAGSCRSDETIPERVGEEERRQRPPKGRFCEGAEFCNCLDRRKVKEEALLL